MTLTILSSEPRASVKDGSANSCATCRARLFCLPTTAPSVQSQGRLVNRRLRVARGDSLYAAGDAVDKHVYAVRYGSFKQLRKDYCGSNVIVGFPSSGDFMGLEAIGVANHSCSTVALEDSEVCELSYSSMRQQPLFFQGLISQCVRETQDVLLQQRRSTAAQRLAAFLLWRSAWNGARGYSETRYRLPMARQDIATFLNLTPECLSRLLRNFQQRGLVTAHRHDITLLDRPGLEALNATGECLGKEQIDEEKVLRPI